MDKFEIESKLYVMPTKAQMKWKMLLNSVLFIYVLFSIFYILIDGFSVYKVGELCLAILMVTYFNSMNKPRYQFSILNVEISFNEINLCYNAIKIGSYTGRVYFKISSDTIEKIEYSKQLNAIRFSGKVVRSIKQKKETVRDVVVYCQEEAHEMIASIEQNFNCKVICLE